MKLNKWIGAVLMCCTGLSQAMTVDFELINPVSSDGGFSDSFLYESDGYSMQVTALSSGGDAYEAYGDLAPATIGLFNGMMGVEDAGMSYTVDNFAYDYDFLVFEFDQEVTMESVGIAYIEGEADSDLSVGAIDSGELFSAGSVYDTVVGENAIEATGIAASIWIVGAFHPFFSAAQDEFWDAFKIDQVSVNVNPVPLPAAAWFMLTGLALLGYYRRRSVAK